MEQRKNQKKPSMHGICFHKIFSSEKKANNNLDSEKQDRTILLKYFPKYIEDLHFKFSDGNLNTRIKHLKLVKNLSCDREIPQNFWRLVVFNKQKSVQFFRKERHYFSDQKYSKLNVQSLKMFPNTREISLVQESSRKYSLKELHWMQRSACYISHLNNLKVLNIHIPGANILQLLSRLKYSQRILGHLKIFDIKCLWPDNQDYRILQNLLTFKEILKYLTNLSLGTLADQGFFEAFQLLTNSCPKLSFLFFRTSQRLSLEEKTYLKSLRNFNNLQKLHFCVYHGRDLFKHCIFPKSLRHLTLVFCEIDWEKFIDNPYSIFAFSNQPENLQNLETLDLSFHDFPERSAEGFSNDDNRAIEIFLQDLLKKIPTCRELIIAYRFQNGQNYDFKRPPFLFNLSQFLKTIEHLSQSLTVLDICAGFHSHRLEDFKVQPNAFPKLSSLSLLMEISPDIEFENIFNLVQAQEPNSSIKLRNIQVNSFETVFNLLRKLGGMKSIIADKRVELTISPENFKGDKECFEKSYEDMKKESVRLKNLFLLIQPTKSGSEFQKELGSLLSLFGDFKGCSRRKVIVMSI